METTENAPATVIPTRMDAGNVAKKSTESPPTGHNNNNNNNNT